VRTLWRLTRRIHAAKQALADGARVTGGRWNPRGVAVVYAGSSIALVALEYFVHLSGDEPSDLVLLEIGMPDDASAESVLPKDLPDRWEEDLAATQARGREWLQSSGSLMLWVPSAIVSEERNALLNPAHPQWERVEVGILRSFHFDRRMYKA
jgi:RES domain-containing protein